MPASASREHDERLIHVKGDASQAAGATAHGGLLIIDGQRLARCGISMKGIDIVVKGSVGHMSAFMAQAGTLTVLGDAGEALGDSLYEAKLFVRGSVASLGADCIEKEMREEHKALLASKLEAAGLLARSICQSSAATARPARSTISTSTTCRAIEGAMTDHSHTPRTTPRSSATFDDYTSRKSAARRRPASMTFEAAAPSAGAPLRRPAVPRRLHVALPAGRLPREVLHRGRARHPLRKKPIELKIPITIAGMSFGSLSANAKEALGRGASAMGTSTTTGDGGMTNEERGHSTQLVYQ